MAQNRVATQAAVGNSRILPINYNQKVFVLGVFVKLTNTPSLTYTVQFTYDDPQGVYATDFATDADWRTMTSMGPLTANAFTRWDTPITAVRLNVSIYASGSATLTIVETE